MHLLSSDAPSTGHQAFPRAVFLVLPEHFRLNAESAVDNRYMANAASTALALTSPERALSQMLAFAAQLRAAGRSVLLFPGLAQAPDGVFPNNVFATVEDVSPWLGTSAKLALPSPSARSKGADAHRPHGRFITAKMRHPSRQIEAQRPDMRHFFQDLLGYQHIDLAVELAPADAAELTGSLVIDRARNIGFCGLSSRCTQAGARAMHRAFGLNKTYVFTLAAGEYHTNVTLSALGGKGLAICANGFANASDAQAIADLYPQRTVWLTAAEKNAFAANCIALAPDQLWLSAAAANALSPQSCAKFAELGFALHTAELSEIEKAGGSLRCTVGEIY